MGYFVGADPERATVVLGRHTTDAVDLLAGSLALAPDSVEHHSNDLPWRARTRTVAVCARPDGTLDEDDLDRQLACHAGHVPLPAVSGASNITGVVPPGPRLRDRRPPGRRTTPGTSTSWPCRATRPTHASAPVP